jgi:hypothetical protein
MSGADVWAVERASKAHFKIRRIGQVGRLAILIFDLDELRPILRNLPLGDF